MSLFLQGIVIILISPLIMGWIKQVKCWLQQRSATPLLQPYNNVYKCLLKKPVLSDHASWLFRFAPYIYFASLAVVSFSLPFFNVNTFSAHAMDFIVLVGVLALGRILLALAAMDVGTAFGSLGARREMFVACLAEPVLLVVFFNVAMLSHSPYLGDSAAFFLSHAMLHPSLFFSLIALLLVLIAETGRIPIDNPGTHLEVTMIHEAMILEYSGRYLALIEWGNAIKLTLYLGFIMSLFFPRGLSVAQQFTVMAIGAFSSLVKIIILTAFIGFVESINSKLRIFKVTDYLAGAFMLAVLGVLVTQVLGVMAS